MATIAERESCYQSQKLTVTTRPNAYLSYEAGAKASLLDHRLRLAAAVFSYDYKDRQIDVFDPVAQLTGVINVGEVQGQGAELELQWVLNRHWDVQLAVGFTDAESRGIPAAACDGLNCDGHRPEVTPEQTASGAVNARYPMAGGDLIGMVEFFWQSDFYGGLNNHPYSLVDSSGKVNVRVGWQDEQWRVVAYVENVGDEISLESRAFTSSFQLAVNASRPRTAGIDISYRFSANR